MSEIDPVARRVLAQKREDESHRQFADRIGVSAPCLSDWRNSGYTPKRQTIENIAAETGWNLEYLLSGRGPLKGPKDVDPYVEGLRDAASMLEETLEQIRERIEQAES